MKNKSVNVLLGMMTVLLLAWGLESCSKKDNPTPAAVDKTALSAAITTATNLLSSTSEGTGNGDYVRGSQAQLQGILTQAQTVNADANATTQAVAAALAQLTTAITAYQAAVIVPVDLADLVGQWTFDEITATAVGTNVKDYSSLGNDGSLQAGGAFWSTAAGMPKDYTLVGGNVPTLTTDRYGNANKALHFQAGANVQVPYSTSLNPGNITIALWIKPDSLKHYWANNYMVALNRWNGFKFQIQDTPRAFFTAYLANAGDSSDLNLDMNAGALKPLTAWYHVAVAFGGGHETFYVNGIQIFDWTTTTPGGPGTILNGNIVNLNTKSSVKFSPVDLTIGQDLPTSKYNQDPNSPFYDQYGAYFIGAMDEVRIYKAALSASQIQAIYNQEKP